MKAISLPYPLNQLYRRYNPFDLSPAPRPKITPPRKPDRRKGKPMSVVVVVKCRNGIVMASDSQTTVSDYKSLRATKIIPFKHGDDRFLVGTVGHCNKAEIVLQQYRSMLANNPSERPEILLQETVRSVREQLRYNLQISSDESLQNFILSEPFDFVLAYSKSGEQRVYSVTSGMVIALEEKKITATGTGGSIASYVLSDFKGDDFDCDLGAVICAYAVNIAKQYDPYCSGDTQIGIVQELHRDLLAMNDNPSSVSNVQILEQKEIKDIDEIMLGVSATTHQERFLAWRKLVEQRTEGLRARVMGKWSELYGDYLGTNARRLTYRQVV